MRFAFVTARYGADITSGPDHACRVLAEQVSSRHDVDVLTTCAVWILLGFEFDLQVVAALLTIIGYSINDTIVIYDRIRETMELHTKVDLADVINRSVNATLSRTILTSGATLLAVLALLTVPAVRPFALAMVIGMISGVYSTVYIASAILLLMERRGAAGRRR